MGKLLALFLFAFGCTAAGGAMARMLQPYHAPHMCLDFVGGKGHLRNCNSQDSQDFKFPTGGGTGPIQVAGACVAMAGEGQPLIGANCRSMSEQQWVLNAETHTLRNPSSGLCIDVRGEGRETGAEVIAYRCTGAANQRWKLTQIRVAPPQLVTLRPLHAESLCVDLEGGGSRILLWRCHGQSNQKFQLPQGVREGPIRIEGSKCLGTGSGRNVAANAVFCHQGNPIWFADGTGQIRNKRFGTCLTVPNRSQRVGTVLVLDACNQGAHQVFIRK
ncbi:MULTISPECIES: ricin-type beta-trefoil lectin domain protein [unclassified Chelatococcus]|uniref:RICIN domain-containing protein n=1 Tax=unclassified Chelatococcus TaxID=2638111 RepID=UPI001BCB5E25|nr:MULTISPECIES: ricin-type beta-trefoil lectin domain protein [unclassified Chelatococcus]MBS7696213.1 ricin-type beta-trefoil lectin domain protein [Chelatococcus sp. YT9]MBX3557760.1 ricin-type beta-trefoil lectin domain protein [Chelatococcus sp.]